MLKKSIISPVLRALLWKEWREQRWRFALGTIVLSGLLGGMLRAQVVPYNQAALLVYWPVGSILVMFFAMGPVAEERAAGTWDFLVAQPVTEHNILTAKWAVGFLQFLAMMLIATLAGSFGIASRRMTPTMLAERAWYHERDVFRLQEAIRIWGLTHPVAWLWVFGAIATLSLVCWYTPLFFLLRRARNELTAGLGAILLTIALHAWLAQAYAVSLGFGWFVVPAFLNPLFPLLVSGDIDLLDRGFFYHVFTYQNSVPLLFALLAYPLLYIVMPLLSGRMKGGATS